MQNPSESQQNSCRIHQNLQKKLSRIHQNLNKTYAKSIRISTKPMLNPSNLNKTHAESIRISTKSVQNPWQSQQNLWWIHHNLNKTHAESITISVKSVQNPSESQQTYAESMRISTKPMQTPSEDKTIQPRLDSQDTSRSLRSTSSSSIRTARISCYQNSIRCHGKMPQGEKWQNATEWKLLGNR